LSFPEDLFPKISFEHFLLTLVRILVIGTGNSWSGMVPFEGWERVSLPDGLDVFLARILFKPAVNPFHAPHPTFSTPVNLSNRQFESLTRR
jgi:hypothetical protein